MTVRTLPAPPLRRREILRYAGCPHPDPATEGLLEDCLAECKDVFTYRCSYEICPLSSEAHEHIRAVSRALARALTGCDGVLLLAVTVGHGIDRLLSRYSRVSPARAAMLQAIGAERVEALAEALTATLSAEGALGGRTLRPRFSPGYGDLPLTSQTELVRRLGCDKHLGITLGASYLLSPSKSVTALAGLSSPAL